MVAVPAPNAVAVRDSRTTDGCAPARALDAVFAGTLFCDVVFTGLPGPPAPGTEIFADGLVLSPGGTATRAVAAARLGLRTAVAGVLGDDAFGAAVLERLRAEPGLDTAAVRVAPEVRTAVTVALAHSGDREFVTYEDPTLRAVTERALAGGLPPARMCQAGIADGVPGWARKLRSAGTLVVGGVGWDASGVWSTDLLGHLDGVDVFVANEAEARAYTRTPSAEEALAVLADRVPVAVVTRGAGGAVARDARTGESAALPGTAVAAVDPTGAGDVFTAAFMYALLQPWTLARRLTFADAAASLSVTRPGGASSAPARAEVDAAVAATVPERAGVAG